MSSIESSPGTAQFLSKRALLLLVGAQSLTLICDGVIAISMPLVLMQRGASGSDIGLTFATVAVGSAVGLFISSGWIDRVSKRISLQSLEAVRLITVVLLVIACNIGSEVFLPGFLTGALIFGAAAACYRPILSGYIGEVVSEENRMAANAIRSSVSKTAAIISPAAGSLFIIISPWFGLIVVSSITCITSFLILSSLVRDQPETRTEIRGFVHESAEGFSYCWNDSVLRRVILQGVIQVGIVLPPLATLLIIHLESIERSNLYGFFFTVEAAGAILGAIIAAKFRFSASRITLMASAGAGTLLPVAMIVENAWFGISAYFVGGLGLGFFGVVWMSYLQGTVDRRVLGRVLNVDSLGPVLIAPLAILVVSAAIHSFTIEQIGTTLTAVGFASVLLLAWVKPADNTQL